MNLKEKLEDSLKALPTKFTIHQLNKLFFNNEVEQNKYNEKFVRMHLQNKCTQQGRYWWIKKDTKEQITQGNLWNKSLKDYDIKELVAEIRNRNFKIEIYQKTEL